MLGAALEAVAAAASELTMSVESSDAEETSSRTNSACNLRKELQILATTSPNGLRTTTGIRNTVQGTFDEQGEGGQMGIQRGGGAFANLSVLPHVDQVLSQRNCVWVACNGDRAICGSSFAFFTIGDSDHRPADLSKNTSPL